MTLEITKGMGGTVVESIGTYTAEQADKMDQDFASWKKVSLVQKKYRIQPYIRLIIDEKQKRIMIDFGDYSYFALVSAENDAEWDALMSKLKH